MDWQMIQAIVSVLGFFGLMVSIGLLIRQNTIAARAARASVYQNIPTQMIEIVRFFVDHPELRPYFYDNKEILEDHPDFNRVMAVAEMLVDFMDGVLTLAPSMG